MRVEIVIIIILLILHVCNTNISEFFSEFLIGTKKIKSTKDGRFYKLVQRKGFLNSSVNYEKSADKLAYMNKIMVDTVRYIRNKYYWKRIQPAYNPYHASINPQKRFLKFISNLIWRFNPSVVIENVPPTIVNTSYVKNKGAEVAFCLRNNLGTDKKIHEDRILQFVALHELTHIATTQIGHKSEFWRCFKFILQEAEKARIHKSINFKKYPETYCSLKIDYNPVFDSGVDALK